MDIELGGERRAEELGCASGLCTREQESRRSGYAMRFHLDLLSLVILRALGIPRDSFHDILVTRDPEYKGTSRATSMGDYVLDMGSSALLLCVILLSTHRPFVHLPYR